MKIEIAYKSKKHTKKIGEAMGKALGVKTTEIEKDTVIEEADILFLGFGIYGGNVHEDVKNFVERLNPEKIKKIVLFSTSGRGDDQTQCIKDEIKECGLNLDDKIYYCRGSFLYFVSRNHPDSNDIDRAVEFAKSFIK